MGGLASPRNPWSFGGGVSHPSFAPHACILTRVASTAGSLRRFSRHPTLPYPSAHLDPKRLWQPQSRQPRPKPRRSRPPSTFATKGPGYCAFVLSVFAFPLAPLAFSVLLSSDYSKRVIDERCLKALVGYSLLSFLPEAVRTSLRPISNESFRVIGAMANTPNFS